MLLVQDNKIADTTAADARRGKDIQGIPWERLSITREKYRQTRLEQYKNYENIPQSGEGSEKVTCIFPWFPIYRTIGYFWIFFSPIFVFYIVLVRRNVSPQRKEGSITSSGETQDL